MTNLIRYLFWRCWRWFYKGYVVLCRRNHYNVGIHFYCPVYKKNTRNIFHRKFAWGTGCKKWSLRSKSMWRWDLYIVFENIQLKTFFSDWKKSFWLINLFAFSGDQGNVCSIRFDDRLPRKFYGRSFTLD